MRSKEDGVIDIQKIMNQDILIGFVEGGGKSVSRVSGPSEVRWPS